MPSDNFFPGCYTRDDGFGTRQLVEDPKHGQVEILDLAPALATSAAERAIRARVEQLEGFGAPLITPTFRVDRDGAVLSVVSAAADGVPLCELLAALEFGTLTLSEAAILELAAVTVHAVGAMHERLGPLAHGALNPAHLMLTRNATVVVTDTVFGEALQQLELGRDELWRTFSLAMPPAATVARFDRRGDVTQLGSVVLAILLRRTLLAHEYPRSAPDLILAAAGERNGPPAGVQRLSSWLQQALQLQPRAMFPSAVEAAQSFADVLGSASMREGGAPALQAAIRSMLGEPAVAPEPAPRPAPAPILRPVDAAPAAPAPAPAPSRGLSFLRSVLPHLRPN